MIFDTSNVVFVKPTILFQQVVKVKRIKKKGKFPMVDRGELNMKVISDVFGKSFRFVGKKISMYVKVICTPVDSPPARLHCC